MEIAKCAYKTRDERTTNYRKGNNGSRGIIKMSHNKEENCKARAPCAATDSEIA